MTSPDGGIYLTGGSGVTRRHRAHRMLRSLQQKKRGRHLVPRPWAPHVTLRLRR
jgi:hypothetical protein